MEQTIVGSQKFFNRQHQRIIATKSSNIIYQHFTMGNDTFCFMDPICMGISSDDYESRARESEAKKHFETNYYVLCCVAHEGNRSR